MTVGFKKGVERMMTGQVPQERDQRRILVNMIMNLRVP